MGFGAVRRPKVLKLKLKLKLMLMLTLTLPLKLILKLTLTLTLKLILKLPLTLARIANQAFFAQFAKKAPSALPLLLARNFRCFPSGNFLPRAFALVVEAGLAVESKPTLGIPWLRF